METGTNQNSKRLGTETACTVTREWFQLLLLEDIVSPGILVQNLEDIITMGTIIIQHSNQAQGVDTANG